MLPQVDYVFDERRRLAVTLFQETIEDSFAQIVEDLVSLCTRQEESGRKKILQSSVKESYSSEPTVDNRGVSAEAIVPVNGYIGSGLFSYVGQGLKDSAKVQSTRRHRSRIVRSPDIDLNTRQEVQQT